MANVHIIPMPDYLRKVSTKYRHQHPPIFDGPPTEADRELARDLFRALDPESQGWYRGGGSPLFSGM